jgi:3-hydroxybutyryl-CoA dehydrogenase
MNILIIGEPYHYQETVAKFGTDHAYVVVGEHREAEKFLNTHELVFDFILDEEPDQFEVYSTNTATAFINTCKVSLAELTYMVNTKLKSRVFGFNGLPTFINRPVMEVSVRRKDDEAAVKQICTRLGTAFLLVDDRVGLVTPRVISMIINEAYYTAQEGTATREDIDMAMKLGTNYPYGPFEWCQKIGVKHVYELLEAIYEDTKDERYKICPLLKKEYLRS